MAMDAQARPDAARAAAESSGLSLALFTALYELTMAQAYWQSGKTAEATFSLFIRRFPQALTAKATGAEAREYFAITSEEVREVPTVNFD